MTSHLRIARGLLLAAALAAAGAARAQAPAGVDSSIAPVADRHGYTLGDSGVTLGGYANAEAADYLGENPAASLRNLSLLLSWEDGRHWSFFSEIELENLLTVNADAFGADNETELVLERLHLDYAWSDALQLRVGKFLTPIGRWNVIHAAPLTWTTSRPLITESTFPTNATGAMLHGVLPVGGRALEWAVYASPGEELLPEDDSDPFKEAYGLRLDYDLGNGLQLGASLVEFEQKHEDGEHRTLYAVDFLWQHAGWELSGEWAYRVRVRGDSSADERGAYLQAVAPIVRQLYGVARYESFDPTGAGEGLHLYIGGLAWRFQPGWVAKLEYRFATDNGVGEPEGWLGSLAVLF